MQTITETQLDEELSDTLIAISVIAKRIARKLQKKNREGGKSYVKNTGTVSGS